MMHKSLVPWRCLGMMPKFRDSNVVWNPRNLGQELIRFDPKLQQGLTVVTLQNFDASITSFLPSRTEMKTVAVYWTSTFLGKEGRYHYKFDIFAVASWLLLACYRFSFLSYNGNEPLRTIVYTTSCPHFVFVEVPTLQSPIYDHSHCHRISVLCFYISHRVQWRLDVYSAIYSKSACLLYFSWKLYVPTSNYNLCQTYKEGLQFELEGISDNKGNGLSYIHST